MDRKGHHLKQSKAWKRFLVAAVASALASVFIVAVGPGFSAPNDKAADQAADATTEETTVTETEEVTTTEEDSTYVADPDTEPGGGDDIEENASTKPDSHGHVGSGTGTSTGSQADPGHMEDTNGTDGLSNGPGTGDEPADDCPNDDSSVNGDTDPGTGGANESGPYDSTCDGRISQNGQGDDAPGKGTPCAGCVGNADDKNPPGQVMEFNGKKANDMGYECDGNQGIGAHYGNGNPAHTGDCDGTTTSSPTCPANSEKNAGMPIPEGETEASFCNEDKPGTAEMTISVDCFSVTVTSSKDISNVVVVFADGTSQKFEGLRGHSFSMTFSKPLSSATAKSATTTVSDSAPENCAKPSLVDVCRNINGTWTIVRNTTVQPGDKPVTASECEGVQSLTDVCRNINGTWTIVRNTTVQPGDKPVTAPECAEVQGLTDVCRNVNGMWTIIRNTTVQPGDKPVTAPECEGVQSLTDVCRNVNGTWTIVRNTTVQPGDKPVTASECAEVESLTDVCRNLSGMWTIVRNTILQPGDKPVTAPECEDVQALTDVCRNVNGEWTIVRNTTLQPGDKPMTAPECDEVLPTRLCPSDSDMPGEPIPPGGIQDCYDDVLDDRITNDGDIDADKGDDVGAGRLGQPRKPLGGVLPFTGTSILAYVLVALQMIGAGLLIARGRRTKK